MIHPRKEVETSFSYEETALIFQFVDEESIHFAIMADKINTSFSKLLEERMAFFSVMIAKYGT